MKRKVSILLLLVLLVTFVPYGFAEDNFNVSHTIIKSEDDVKSIDVVLPIFEGFNGADKINEGVLNIALDAIGEANAFSRSMMPIKKELIEKGEVAASMVVNLDMTYDYEKLGDLLSVQLNIYSYYGGAHGTSQVISITANTSTGEIYEFKDLFKQDTDYNSAITNCILEEIDKNPEWYFPNYEETIANKEGNYEFYIDGDKLVVYFGLYDIAPYAAGIRHFIIDSEDIKDILKDEVYNSIKDGKERGHISYNGKDIDSDEGVIQDNNTILLPLRSIAETLGYDVDWNKNDGAIVDGKPVSVESLVIIDGSTYVPLTYFKDSLGERVSLGVKGNDKFIARVYSNEVEDNYLYTKISEFEKPEAPLDAIKMYAEAVKMRDGVAQYGLMEDQLRDQKYNEFKEMGFVTGTSSPWVDSYEIKQLEEDLYQIIFTYKTSVPADIFTSEINVRLIEDGLFIKLLVIE
ncbi:DUF3298 domain-containing protein [Tissierella sp. Yu-01]|uniref:DUF3298 domain-containing protein n=1 Tax=Tissierella sp. Yu-01 TaxID=3035694 RepID=UPI00240E4431|nr:DUF3298 domain-containing protein [Tissierella sp. Yu-01]WFA09911.1 DUF3298 domain-containing protein [Tissierella sp. Yu-01]